MHVRPPCGSFLRELCHLLMNQHSRASNENDKLAKPPKEGTTHSGYKTKSTFIDFLFLIGVLPFLKLRSSSEDEDSSLICNECVYSVSHRYCCYIYIYMLEYAATLSCRDMSCFVV